jgi:hypothetical protein
VGPPLPDLGYSRVWMDSGSGRHAKWEPPDGARRKLYYENLRFL